MVFLILVNLYTSRIVINALGIEDYGLYSVVGAVVIFLSFLNNSMTAAAQRFLSYSKGKETLQETQSIFNSLVVVQYQVAGLIFLLAETLGVTYIEFFLNVSPDKICIAHVVFQLSLLSLLVKVVAVPYTASIIANEKMSAFALISIVEGVLQLIVSLLLSLLSSRRLLWYAILMLIIVFLTQISYLCYSRRKFQECSVNGSWKRKDIENILRYSGWNLLGAFSSVASDQGVNMVLNSFFGVVVNAARGIAFQVSAAVASLSGNFQQAINPQIVKNYASGELHDMHKLIIKGTKFTFFLLFVMAVPFLFNMHPVLSIWLGIVPEYSVVFCRLILINAMIVACSGSLLIGAMATGKIKKYQITVATINLLNLPLSYMGLVMYPHPYITVYIMLVLSIVAFFVRLFMVSKMIELSKKQFLFCAIVPIIKVLLITFPILFLIYSQYTFETSFLSLFFSMVICFFITCAVIYIVGLSASEKKITINLILKTEKCK